MYHSVCIKIFKIIIL